MKYPNTFSKIYAMVLVGLISVASWSSATGQHQQWGIIALLVCVPLLIGFPRVVQRKISNQKEEYGAPKIPTFDTDQNNPELMSWSGLIIPWCGSLFINIVMNIFLIEHISPNTLIGMELLISTIFTVGVLWRSGPTLVKYGREGVFIMFLVPMSSVVVALILSAWWPSAL